MDGEATGEKAAVGGEDDSRPDEPQTGPGARNRLLTLGAAAVMMVYAAGYDRTREVAQRFADDDARPHVPSTATAVQPGPVPKVPAATVPSHLSQGRDDNVVQIPRCARDDKAG